MSDIQVVGTVEEELSPALHAIWRGKYIPYLTPDAEKLYLALRKTLIEQEGQIGDINAYLRGLRLSKAAFTRAAKLLIQLNLLEAPWIEEE